MLSTEAGGTGYLREAYHGTPYATRHLCAEAFAMVSAGRQSISDELGDVRSKVAEVADLCRGTEFEAD